MISSDNFSCRPVAKVATRFEISEHPRTATSFLPVIHLKGERCDLETGREGSAMVVEVSYRGFLGIPTR